MEYSIILTPEPERGFTILIPDFPEYVGFAADEEEGRALAAEGILFEMERLPLEGEEPPIEATAPRIIRIAA